MSDRRTLSEASKLTPQLEAFIRDGLPTAMPTRATEQATSPQQSHSPQPLLRGKTARQLEPEVPTQWDVQPQLAGQPRPASSAARALRSPQPTKDRKRRPSAITAAATDDRPSESTDCPQIHRRSPRPDNPQRTPSDSQHPRDSAAVLDDILVPLTTKLRRKTITALRRAYLEQKLANRQPATQQEIIEQAVSDWLARSGFGE